MQSQPFAPSHASPPFHQFQALHFTNPKHYLEHFWAFWPIVPLAQSVHSCTTSFYLKASSPHGSLEIGFGEKRVVPLSHLYAKTNSLNIVFSSYIKATSCHLLIWIPFLAAKHRFILTLCYLCLSLSLVFFCILFFCILFFCIVFSVFKKRYSFFASQSLYVHFIFITTWFCILFPKFVSEHILCLSWSLFCKSFNNVMLPKRLVSRMKVHKIIGHSVVQLCL